MSLADNRERIADLYFASNTVQFGEFKLSIHRDHPELPLSPWYLHYPTPDQPGREYLPALYDSVGEAFYELCESQPTPIRPSKLAPLPKGAMPLAKAHASHYVDSLKKVITFDKFQHPTEGTKFINPRGTWEYGDELITEDDHISGARNNILFVKTVRKLGFTVSKTLVVVDRQQGGAANLMAHGVGLLSIMTARELLEHGVHNGYITTAKLEAIEEYRQLTQFVVT